MSHDAFFLTISTQSEFYAKNKNFNKTKESAYPQVCHLHVTQLTFETIICGSAAGVGSLRAASWFLQSHYSYAPLCVCLCVWRVNKLMKSRTLANFRAVVYIYAQAQLPQQQQQQRSRTISITTNTAGTTTTMANTSRSAHCCCLACRRRQSNKS